MATSMIEDCCVAGDEHSPSISLSTSSGIAAFKSIALGLCRVQNLDSSTGVLIQPVLMAPVHVCMHAGTESCTQN